MATPGRQTEIDELWVRLWPQARDGRRTVKDLLAEFVPQANSLSCGFTSVSFRRSPKYRSPTQRSGNSS